MAEEETGAAAEGSRARLAALAANPATYLVALLVIVLAMSWQFITDPARAVPAFDTAFYQWRVEFLLENDPGALIELRGADGSIAAGYRVAEPVLGALMRTVGGVAAGVPTIVLSVLFRVVAGALLAAFVWQHRESRLTVYVTLFAIPALFLLQQFFGFLDNFFALALMAGVLVLIERIQTSWVARIAATSFLFLGGLTHPTTLALFLLAMGAVAGWHLLRDRSIREVVRRHGWIVATGTAGVVLTAGFWLGGPWGPTSSFGDAAVPPPETVSFFINRSLSVLGNLQPYVLVPLIVLGLGWLVVRVVRERSYFAELTIGWTLPLVGMFGFVVGAAYPYFRFFNGTLAPLLLASVGLVLLVEGARRIERAPWSRFAPILAGVAVIGILGWWWARGISDWNDKPTWQTPAVRESFAAASGYLGADAGTTAVFVGDTRPGTGKVPYGQYKEFANQTFAGIEGSQIDATVLYFGGIDDLAEGRATRTGDEVYDRLAADTADEAIPALERASESTVVFAAGIHNELSPNADVLGSCDPAECVPLSESGLFLLPDLSDAESNPEAINAARDAAAEARAFVADPPGAFENFGGTLAAILRLGLLFVVPGLLLYLGLPGRGWLEAVALVPTLSIAAVTTVGVFAVGVLRDPFTDGTGWMIWGVAVVLGAAAAIPALLRGREIS